ncbi:MAG: ABC transporter ATP-binding protein [Deltaproteobacteria bacterium]|nr:ABC transporter ATP-binding protein [Deltaproteobacteria bacterium]
MPPLLEVRDLSAGYGQVPVLHEVSLTVSRLETVCVLGANGAGKSTLVNRIAGILRPSRGTIRFDGEDVTGLSPERLAAKGLSLVRQGRSVFPFMTVQENLDMGAYLLKDRRAVQERLETVFEMFPVLKERLGQRAGSMSGGEQKMLEIGRSLMLPLKLLMLDEPSLGLAPLVLETIFARIREFNERSGLTILLVEQNAFGALEISHRGYVLELGRVRLEGPSERLRTDPEVRERYLGAGAG